MLANALISFDTIAHAMGVGMFTKKKKNKKTKKQKNKQKNKQKTGEVELSSK